MDETTLKADMDAPVKDNAKFVDPEYFEADGEPFTEDQRAFIRSMQQAARGEGQPLAEFLEELRQEMLEEGLLESNGSHRDS